MGYFFSVMIWLGSFLAVFGLMMLSLAHEYYAIFLSQGVCMGLGFGLLYIPSIALISRSFTHKRGVALGVATSGAPAGGIIYTVLFDRLIAKLSFAWTARIIGFVMLFLFLVAIVILLSSRKEAARSQTNGPRKLFDTRALKDLPFWSFTVANVLLYLGYIAPFYYIPTYAQTKLHTSRSLASYLLIVAQASSIIGRVVTTLVAHFADGSMVSWIVCGMMSGILCFAWISADTLTKFILFVAFYGMSQLVHLMPLNLSDGLGGFSGALIPLPPSIFPHVCPYPGSFGTWLGMAQSISSFASLSGPPIAGAVASIGAHGTANLNFVNLQVFTGTTMLVGAFELLLLWYLLYTIRNKKGMF